MSTDAQAEQIVYWHRDLPPLEAETVGEHVVEATSRHVHNDIVHRDELWEACRDAYPVVAVRDARTLNHIYPDDFPELVSDPRFTYEDGILAGLISAQIALRALIREQQESDAGA